MEPTAPILLLCRNAELIEGIRQHFSDLRRLAAFNLEAMQGEDGLAVPKKRDGGGRRRHTGQQFADPGDRLNIRAGEYGSCGIGPIGVL